MSTNNTPITVPVRLDTEAFRNFAVFDSITRQRRWFTPVVSGVILLVCSVLCFVQAPKQGAILLGAVLIVLALGLPGVYFGMFLRSVNRQAKLMNLDTPRAVYTLRFTPEADGIHAATPAIANTPATEADFAWDTLYGVWRYETVSYLYTAANKAYILPTDQVQGGMDGLWALITEKLPAEKCHDLRKKK